MFQRFAHKLKGTVQLLVLPVMAIVAVGTAQAQTGFTNHNPEDPIRFTADRLEVKKEGRVAAFIGNVDARQGELLLSADIVKVYYKNADADEDDDNNAGFGGSISRIDTSGNVVIESHGDTAVGDWAVYDIPRKIVTLGGQVVLTRQDTVLRGSRLELDLVNGRSTIQSSETSQGDTRVRGEFAPASGSEN
jgi:lipopolysaccharide export system protein LptA